MYFLRVIVTAVSVTIWISVLIASIVGPGYLIWWLCCWIGIGYPAMPLVVVFGSVLPDSILLIAIAIEEKKRTRNHDKL